MTSMSPIRAYIVELIRRKIPISRRTIIDRFLHKKMTRHCSENRSQSRCLPGNVSVISKDNFSPLVRQTLSKFTLLNKAESEFGKSS